MNSAAAVIRRALAASVRRLLDNEAVALEGTDPEGVHQVRVATRRLRSDLRTFRPLLDEAWAGTLRAHLERLADVLGEARDADVMLGGLLTAIEGLPEQQRDAARPLIREMRQQRRRARARLLRTMRSRSYAAVVKELRAAGRRPHTLAAAEKDAVAVLPSLAMKPWRELRSGVRRLGREPDDGSLHRVRILAKRARYAAEAIAPVAAAELQSIAKALAGLQDELGAHQDAVVLQTWVQDTAVALHVDGGVLGEILAVMQSAAARSRQNWPKRWRAVLKARPAGWR